MGLIGKESRRSGGRGNSWTYVQDCKLLDMCHEKKTAREISIELGTIKVDGKAKQIHSIHSVRYRIGWFQEDKEDMNSREDLYAYHAKKGTLGEE